MNDPMFFNSENSNMFINRVKSGRRVRLGFKSRCKHMWFYCAERLGFEPCAESSRTRLHLFALPSVRIFLTINEKRTI